MSSLYSKKVADVLDKLFGQAEAEDPAQFEQLQAESARLGRPPDESWAHSVLAEVFMPVDRAGGRFLYVSLEIPIGDGMELSIRR